MKIVTVCLDLSPSHGGMFRAVVDVARMLSAPIVTFRDGSGGPFVDPLEVSVTVIDWQAVSSFRRAMWAPRAIVQAFSAAIAGADAIVVHSLFRAHAMLAAKMARAMSVPYISIPHGALDPTLWQSKWVARRVWMAWGGRAFLRNASRIVFASEAERRGAVATLGWEPPWEVIPFPVALPQAVRERQSSRSALGLPVDKRLFLVLGRLAIGKRPGEIVTAFCQAAPPGCDLVMAGPEDGVTVPELRAMIPPNMEGRVWFTGQLDAAARDAVLAACDVYVSWSQHESFGYAAAEAMGAGRPVLLSPGNVLQQEPGWPECGVVAASAHRESLVTAFQTCAAWSDCDIKMMGERGREWVASRLSPAVVAARWQDVIRRVVEQKA